MKDYSVSKGTAEAYFIRPKHGFGWGIFLLEETTGTLTCMTDYGVFAYRWGNNPGYASLKEFLARNGNDRHYFLKKLAGQRYIEYKHKETVQRWKRALLKSRRANQCSRDDARYVWNLIDKLKDNEVLAVREMLNDETAVFVLEWGIACRTVTDYNASAICFIDKLWPLFIETLREEIEEAQ